jgi:cysteinyl-tRNA synthetase
VATQPLKVYNSLTRKKEDFVPLSPPQVKMYVCGPTVYDYLHVGNFRGPVVFNLVRNWLEHLGYKVTFALNFTDVDDRIINRANREKQEPQTLANHYIEEYKKDFASLGLRPHDLNPKVTDTMPEILDLISKLIENNKAYVVDGDVNYSIKNFPEYGKLSGRNVEELQAGARVEVDEKKDNALDFALWKACKPGEPFWESPWGKGRPGWHIECSAMICKHFGEQIDIHGGGSDLIFPHHENEIAQSEGVTGKTFAKYWMHNHMLNFSGQKMSKSIGNVMTMRNFLQAYNAEIYKWMILSTHYRSLCDFSEDAVHRAVSGLARVYSALAMAEEFYDPNVAADPAFLKVTEEAWKKVEESLSDDFNTPEAFAAMFEVVRVFNSQIKRGMKANPAIQGKAKAFVEFIHKVGKPMSLFQEKAAAFLLTLDNMLLVKMNIKREDIDILVTQRSQARLAKDFKKSDELRAQLSGMGISVMDTPDGSVWEVTK